MNEYSLNRIVMNYNETFEFIEKYNLRIKLWQTGYNINYDMKCVVEEGTYNGKEVNGRVRI